MLKPQEGFQEMVLSTPADHAWIGGAAGAGKTFVELLESTRHISNADFGFTIFRRTTPQIRNVGGLWDTSLKVYPLLGAQPSETALKWRFPSGAVGKFAHLEFDKDVLEYQGSQIPLIIFDELTHFSEYQYWYMASRNRDPGCGVRPYMRASCNPDPSSWVATTLFDAGYIDKTTGYAIAEMSGKLKYFTRFQDAMIWGDTKEEVLAKSPHIYNDPELKATGINPEEFVKSFTFIPGQIYDNKELIRSDPGYLGTLMSLSHEEQLRLLKGNWLISLDGLQLCDGIKLMNVFSNYPAQEPRPRYYITVDAARFGRDFCVIMVWKGWEMIFMIVIKVSDTFDIVKQVEFCRQKFNVMRDDVVVDQDGVGDGTVKMGQYTGFHGGSRPRRDPISRIKERYENYKTQCYYRFCQNRINTGQVRFSITDQTCIIFEIGDTKGRYTTKTKIGGAIVDVRDLLLQDFRAARRLETPNEGVDTIKMERKVTVIERIKRSPDFSDCAIMREHIELRYSLKSMTSDD